MSVAQLAITNLTQRIYSAASNSLHSFNGNMNYIYTVSYTHLDVYKRQVLLIRLECSSLYSAWRRLPIVWAKRRFSIYCQWLYNSVHRILISKIRPSVILSRSWQCRMLHDHDEGNEISCHYHSLAMRYQAIWYGCILYSVQ